MSKDKRSLKIKAVDKFFLFLFGSNLMRDKIKIITDRALVQYFGYKFSYDSSENGEIEFIAHLAKIYKDQCFRFFDIGAHHGTYTAMILDLFDNYNGQLFEPTPESYKKLCSVYNGNERLTLHNSAMSNFTGEAEFISYPDDPTRNGLSGVGKEITFSSEDILCSVIRGDDFCQIQNINSMELLKIDAEGHDFNVIIGFDKILSKKGIDVVQFEYTFKHADLGIPLRKYYDYFKSKGYALGPIRKKGVEFYNNFDPRFNEYEFGPNYLAVKLELVDKFRFFLR